MAENDAEWFDPSSPSGPDRPRPAGPNNPPPRPTTTTTTTTVRPRWNGGRRRCRVPPCRPREAPDMTPPQPDHSITIAISVVGALFLVVLILLLLYMFVLRKKLHKMKTRQSDSQYGLRVEDATHLSAADDSAKLFVNTTDLQKLVSSIRIKDQNLSSSTPVTDSDDGNYPDVIRVGRPPAPLPLSGNDRMYNSVPTLEPAASPELIYANVGECYPPNITPVRPAPPLPPGGAKSFNDVSRYPNVQSGTLLQENPTKNTLSKPSPPSFPKPTPPPTPLTKPVGAGTPHEALTQAKPSPAAISRPRIPPSSTPSPTSIPTLKKPQQSRPLLPRLKMNLIPAVGRQDSEFSTPDTAISYVGISCETPVENPPFEPRSLSVKERKAMLEGIIHE